LELRRYLSILRRRIVLIALTVAIAVAFAIVSTDRTQEYTAQTTLYIGAKSFGLDNGSAGAISGDQAVGFNQLIRTFATMIRSIPIAEDAVNRTGLPRSAASVVAQTAAIPVPQTNILLIKVNDPDPAVAQGLAIGVAEAFVAKIGQLEPGSPTSEGGLPAAPVTIFERAQLPTSPSTNSSTSNIVTAALFGLLLSTGLVLLIEYLDITVKSRDDAEYRLELPVLGIVPLLPLDPSTTRPHAEGSRRDDLDLVRDA